MQPKLFSPLGVVASAAIFLGLLSCLGGGCMVATLVSAGGVEEILQLQRDQVDSVPGLDDGDLRRMLRWVLAALAWGSAMTGTLLATGGAATLADLAWGRYLLLSGLLLTWIGSGFLAAGAGLQMVQAPGLVFVMMAVQLLLTGLVWLFALYGSIVVWRGSGPSGSEANGMAAATDPAPPEDVGEGEGRW